MMQYYQFYVCIIIPGLYLTQFISFNVNFEVTLTLMTELFSFTRLVVRGF